MIIDLLILVFAVSSFYRGRELGLVRQISATVGFFGGLFLGAWLQPLVAKLSSNPIDHTLITLSCTLGLALVGLIAGEAIGVALKRKLLIRPVNHYDNQLGSLVNIVSLLLSVWLVSAILSALPVPAVKATLSDSKIVNGLNKTLPPAPKVLSNFGKLLVPNGFPQVFIGTEPAPQGNVDLPSLGELQAAVQADQASVVRIEGLGCGGLVDGSGFVVGKNLVATNAHVVAGIRNPYISDQDGTRRAKAIYFDPNLDFALLSVPTRASPLELAGSTAKSGTPAAVLGYPGGGPFDAEPAAVIDTIIARGRNIYNQGVSKREVYELRAQVIPGNSGGPVVGRDGRVIGVVFAESTTYANVGYALTTPSLTQIIARVNSQSPQVATGQCAAE